MSVAGRDQAVVNARSVSGAADALLRAVKAGGPNLERAADRLEMQAAAAISQSAAAFDSTEAGGSEPDDEDVLAESLSQLSIGLTLVTAESAVSDKPDTQQFDAAIATLNRTADVLEAGARTETVQAFDARPNGEQQSVVDAALAALDEMAAAAATVATSLLSKAFKPLIDKLPANLRGTVSELSADLAGRFIGWGLKAVRRGLDMLLSIVELGAVESARTQIDEVLARLGKGSDPAVITGWAIGVEDVRQAVSGLSQPPGLPTGPETLDQLSELASRYASLCTLLKRIAVVITSLAATIALFHVTIPHALAATTVGLGLVLGAVVVFGRDYTGANDLPGRVRGVRLLVLDSVDGT